MSASVNIAPWYQASRPLSTFSNIAAVKRNDRNRSHSEELALSTTGPLYPRTADVRAISQQVGVGPIPEVASLFDHPVDAGAERRRKFERCRSASIFRTPGDYLFTCRDCKHNGGKDRTCVGDKRRSCALTAPTHCPMVMNLEISPRTSTRNLCVRNFVQSNDRSKICTAAERTEVPRLTCDYPRTRTGIATAHRSITLKTVTSIITSECNFRGGIT
jgi:hypothetical protein